jgi:hypothetical protein
MKFRNLVIVPALAVSLLAFAACSGGSSDNSANAADSTATNAASDTTANTPASAMPAASGMAAGADAAIPNCGAVKAVWVNLKTKVYHEAGDRMYGKTKKGEYLCPAAAKAQGFHAARHEMNNSNNR